MQSPTHGHSGKVFVTLLLFALCSSALQAQNIEIKLLNGRTGHPVTHACVGAWMKKPGLEASVFIPVDKDGVARLRLTKNDSEVNISYDPKLGCGGTSAINPVLKYDDTLMTYTTGFTPSCAIPESVPNGRFKDITFPTKEVLQHGVVSANVCGKFTASPQPGLVILFVRPRNFHEKVQDWKGSEYFPL